MYRIWKPVCGQYIILDFETGETVFSMDVASKPMYNNMAIGMYAGNSGNALYCPTGYLELLRLQDRFVYLPEMLIVKSIWTRLTETF